MSHSGYFPSLVISFAFLYSKPECSSLNLTSSWSVVHKKELRPFFGPLFVLFKHYVLFQFGIKNNSFSGYSKFLHSFISIIIQSAIIKLKLRKGKKMDFLKNILFPQYNGKSICNILPSLARLYSIKPKDQTERIPFHYDISRSFKRLVKGCKRIVIFEIDGLGFDRIAKIKNKFLFLKENVFKITSVFPTYTHVAFTSFVTGTPPSIHGLVAGTFRLSNQIRWIGEIPKGENLILARSLLREFDKSGFKTYSILYDVNNDNFSKQLYPKRIFVSSKFEGKNLIEEARIVEKRVFQKVQKFARKDFFLLTAYFWYLDGITGKYGKFSPESINHCVFLFEEISKLQNIFPRDTLFIFMGDHGHTNLKKNVLLDQEKIQEISNLSNSQLAIDGRTLMFYSQKPRLTKELFERYYGKYVKEIPKEDYLALLGPRCSVETKNRVGNLIYEVIPEYTLRLKPKDSKATHGGRSREEMETVFGFWRN